MQYQCVLVKCILNKSTTLSKWRKGRKPISLLGIHCANMLDQHTISGAQYIRWNQQLFNRLQEPLGNFFVTLSAMNQTKACKCSFTNTHTLGFCCRCSLFSEYTNKSSQGSLCGLLGLQAKYPSWCRTNIVIPEGKYNIPLHEFDITFMEDIICITGTYTFRKVKCVNNAYSVQM